MEEMDKSWLLEKAELAKLNENQKSKFLSEWLIRVDNRLKTVPKGELKSVQKQLLDQLLGIINEGPGPTVRNLTAKCMTLLFLQGDTVFLFETVNKCNDHLKAKDDSPSYLAVKLSAVACLSEMYEKLGRMMGRSYEETIQQLSRNFKNMESQYRIATVQAFQKICMGMDTAASSAHKEMYRIARICLTDRVMAVRTASANCIKEMLSSASFLYTTELESLTSLCFRALDGADYDTRISIAELLGHMMSCTQQPPSLKGKGLIALTIPASKSSTKSISLGDTLTLLMTGFLRGATSFLKGEIIKGSSGVNRDVRVGVTYAYIAFVEKMGPQFLEKNMETFITHLLELVANPKAATTHVDAVYSRKCVNFLLRTTIGRLLGEKAQYTALKIFNAIVLKQMNSIDFDPENAKECNQETIFNQHLLVCALQEMSSLFCDLGSGIQHMIVDSTLGMLDGIFSVLIHPCAATRLAAAWALRCLCVSVPSETNKCVERCIQAFDSYKSSPEAVAGYSAALSAILGCVTHMPLGIPYSTGKIVFNTAEELLRCANQSSRMSIQRSNAGWLMIGSIMTLGNSVVKALLPRMLLLWRNSFPKSAKELESEKARGDAFTWQVTIEGRSGALSAIHSFLKHCPDLATDEIISRLVTPIESALAMLTNLSSTLKQYGHQLKAPAANLRYRLYQTLSLIKPSAFERSYTHMLRFVVWELTLNDNVANTTTSLFTTMCQTNSIFNSLTSDHASIEDQLQPTGASGAGALEHDSCSLYQGTTLDKKYLVPSPYPLGVSVIDSSIELFGLLYPQISTKHRNQLVSHFLECLKVTKLTRKEAILINIYCAILCAMERIRKLNTSSSNQQLKKEDKGCEELKSMCNQIITGTLGHPNPRIRCASAEVMGKIAQVAVDSRFTAEMNELCTNRLKMSRDVASRTGHSLGLGCLHKYLGGMDSSRHQHSSVSILLNLAQDTSSPETQVWALHSLALVADTGGPLFRSYVQPSLNLIMKLINAVPLSCFDLRQASGKLMAALITCMGPELQADSIKETNDIKSSLDTACTILSRSEEHSVVQNETITCFQRMHLFGSKVNLDIVVPILFRTIQNSSLLLRRSSIDFIRQLSQRDGDVLYERAESMFQCEDCPFNEEFGILGALFLMLDMESDFVIRKGIRDSLQSLLTIATKDPQKLETAVLLCKSILTCDTSTADIAPDETIGDFDDDVEEFKIGNDDMNTAVANNNSRWSSRVFAAECVRKILIASPHIKSATGPELVRHISDLIRMSFMGATSNCSPLRLEGLLNLESIIDNFAHIEDPFFPSASILEQFQAQVNAALRPAFSSESDPSIKSTACRVCSAWICGNTQAGDDLKRAYNLLSSALDNFKSKPTLPDYNESANTLEKLAILKAWAQVFVTAVEKELQKGKSLDLIIKESSQTENSILKTVKPELEVLAPFWISALRDRALIELPPEFAPQLPRDGGAFFTNEAKEIVRAYYRDSWPPILLASSVCVSVLPNLAASGPQQPGDSSRNSKQNKFHLVFGLSMEALYQSPFSETLENVEIYLKSLWCLLNADWTRDLIFKEKTLSTELCCVLHRQLVSRCDIKVQLLIVRVLKLVITAMKENHNKTTQEKKFIEAGTLESEELIHGKSVVLSILEVIFCLLTQKITILNANASGFQVKPSGSAEDNDLLLSLTVECLQSLPDICDDEVAQEIQGTILYLSTCVLSEGEGEEKTCDAILKFYSKMATHHLNRTERWEQYLLSTLAKLLDLVKTVDNDTNQDNEKRYINVLRAISVFLTESPARMMSVANVLYPTINLFQQAFQSSNEMIQIHSVSILSKIFEKGHQLVVNPLIHSIAPRILEYLYHENRVHVKTQNQLKLTMESINCIESLVKIVEKNEKRVQVLRLIVPALVMFLLDGNNSYMSAISLRKKLHDFCLQKILYIALHHKNEFRMLMSQSAEMRYKLEAALKSSGKSVKQDGQKSSSVSSAQTSTTGSIKLKTDFSNFSYNP